MIPDCFPVGVQDFAEFKFANADARSVLNDALAALTEQKKFALLITGPYRSGKSMLARKLLQAAD